MSCNGCRVLRKGCSDDCTLRPCLEWIKSPVSQANATLFLAKFYGRAGLINLINAGPTHLHPEVFRSLLYEACGRIINPVHGSIGLMSSSHWPRCQSAVEAVLHGGSPTVTRFSGENEPPAHGIRHLTKDSTSSLRRVRTRTRFKRSKCETNSIATGLIMSEPEAKFTITGWDFDRELERASSHDSVETVELALVDRVEQPVRGVKPEPSEIGLELTLGMNRLHQTYYIDISDSE